MPERKIIHVKRKSTIPPQKKGLLDVDLDFDEPFKELHRLVAPRKEALTGELGFDILKESLGKTPKGYGPAKAKGILDL